MAVKRTVGYNGDENIYLCQLGQGSNGSVHVYFNKATGLLRAVKFAGVADFFANMREFDREITAYGVPNPAAIKLLSYGIPEGLDEWGAYLEMEYLAGGTLLDYTVRRFYPVEQPLDYSIVVPIFVGICHACAHLHATGLTHRDIKPANILLDANLKPYLADFGFTRVLAPPGQNSIIGTPTYMAPEIENALSYTNSVDVYALGMTLYTVCMGHLPFAEICNSPDEAVFRDTVAQKLRDQSYHPVLDDRYALFHPLFDSMTNYDPSLRPSMIECADWLMTLAQNHAEELQIDYAALVQYDAELRLGHPRDYIFGTLQEVRAAAEYNPLALAVFGVMMHRGIGVEKNVERGIQLLCMADARECESAREELKKIMEDDPSLEIPLAERRMSVFDPNTPSGTASQP
jgi:serine/threonine protein kinase